MSQSVEPPSDEVSRSLQSELSTEASGVRAATIPRRHDLDALRAIAMLLGIVLHAGMAYLTVPWVQWLFSGIHGFRMPLFFVISGFFTAMLWRKRGVKALLRHRAKRILAPLALFMVTLIPLTFAVVFGTKAAQMNAVVVKDDAVAGTIWLAAKDNDVDALAELIPSASDLNAPDAFKLAPLHWAALNGSVDACNMLLDAGADVDVRSGDQSTPLTQAMFLGRPKIVAILLERGADRNPINVYQSTPIESAFAGKEIVQAVADSLKLDVDLKSLDLERGKCVGMLIAAGGKRRAEVGQPEKEVDDASVLGQLNAAREWYRGFTDWPGFHRPIVFLHLWFLWFLCLLLVPFTIYAVIADRVGWKGVSGRVIASPWLLLWAVPLTMIPGWFEGLRQPAFGPDTSLTPFPMPHTLLMYAIYFFAGALYFDADDREGRIGKLWWLWLPIAVLVVLPVGLFCFGDPSGSWANGLLSPRYLWSVQVFCEALFPWLMTLGCIGLFRVICSKESKVMRYISDSSYWLYVAHIPVVALLNFAISGWEAPVAVKFALVTLLSTLVLLASYEWLVRYRWLGTLMNGKRVRAEGTAAIDSKKPQLEGTLA